MADELSATGRVYNIQFSRGFRREYKTTKLGYGFNDPAGGRHFRWIELRYGIAGTAYGYDIAKEPHASDPERDMQEAWWMKCGVEALLVIY